MKPVIYYIFSGLLLLLTANSCQGSKKTSPSTSSLPSDSLTTDALLDTVQRRTFLYFWDGAEPNSGLAPERIHMDGNYPAGGPDVVTSGGSGFGIMAILAGINRGYVSRTDGLVRMEKIVSFLERADRSPLVVWRDRKSETLRSERQWRRPCRDGFSHARTACRTSVLY